MTLANRVSAFFLGWLGLSLGGFAVAVYGIERADRYQQADDRLAGTLDTLVAASEVDARGVEWEPQERALDRSASGPFWQVLDPEGKVIHRSAHADDLVVTEESWRIARRRLDTPGPAPAHYEGTRYPHLEFVAALPTGPIHAGLVRLGCWLAAVTVGLWLIAAVVGRWLCRRTLAPVADMAAVAQKLGPAAPGERLVVRERGDELEDLGRAFNSALDRLEDAFERQRRFTGNASHQLRTPLAAMLGQVEVALRRDREAADYRDTLRSVADEVRHLHRLTEALLFLARADADAARPDLQTIDLPAWAVAHGERWRERNAGVRLDVVATGDASRVRAHPELLAQLVDNLLDNAVKYGPASGPVAMRISGPALTVEDAGPGIHPADLSHVFDPFFRAPAARTAGVSGVGLGLAVVQRVAEAMGAELVAESVVGSGSRFTVRLAGGL